MKRVFLVLFIIVLGAFGMAAGVAEHSAIGWCVFAVAIMAIIVLVPYRNNEPTTISSSQKGIRYEEYCVKYLLRRGFRGVKTTPVTGDYGADLIAIDRRGRTWVFQCKKYAGKVSVDAVQEIVAAKAHYNASKGAVITNSMLTESAKRLAWENAIEIIEGLSD